MDVIIFPALLIGFIIGLIELVFVHADEGFSGSHWIGHGLHAVIFAIIFVFIVMNVNYVLSLIKVNLPYQEIAISAIVAVIAFIKIQGAAAGAGKAVREKMWHTLFIVALIVASPYVWKLLQPLCLQFLGKTFC